MSLSHEVQNGDPDEVVTLWGDASGAVLVPNSTQLFNGAFLRVGPDLYIVNDGTANFRVPDYFAQPKAADLTDPNGAVLRGDLVERLAGPLAPGQYAQAGTLDQPTPIGQVESTEGSATVKRMDGTVEELQVGSKIYQNDVVATGESASVSLTFVDGTIFTLSEASRMVIDELIYDPQSDENSGTFSLIQGGFVFIAGQVAKTGGMDVSTPSSTMGIRGTTVVVQVGTVDGVDTTEVSLTTDPDGGQGRVELRDIDGNLIALITQTDTKWIVSAATGETREVARSLVDDAEDNLLIAEAFAAFRSAVARVDAGDTFVSLPAAQTTPTSPGPTDQTEGDLTPDIPDAVTPIAPSEPVETDEGDEGDETPEPFDEGLNAVQEESPVIVVSGPEDAGPDDAIQGDIGVIGAANAAFVLLAGPANGSVSVGSDGQFDYVPEPDFNGTDSFTFAATQPDGQVIEGTVIVQVLPVNDAPVGETASFTVAEDGIVTGVVAARDVDGDVLSYSITDLPQDGEVTLFPDGTFTYRPDADFTGQDGFGVLVTDPFGETAQAQVIIEISPVNDAPVVTTFTGANLGVVIESDEVADASGQLIAEDPDRNSTVTWSGTSNALFGTFAITVAGAWSYVLDTVAADGLAEGETVVETFTAVATDEFGASATQTVEVTLTGTNDAPIVMQNTVFEGPANGSVAGQLSASDADSAGFVFALGAEAPSNGVLALGTDGSFQYTPEDGFAGLDSFSYSVTDPVGGVATGQVTIAVESITGGTGADAVSMSLIRTADAETAAGALAIETAAAEPQAINISIAMDSSGSIGIPNWAAQRQSVKEAVQQLAERFEGSATSVDVQIINYSSAAVATGPYDLHDPELQQAIMGLPFRRGSTRWDLALDEANAFFSSQPPDEANVLLFITDGVPSTDNWREALDALRNPPGAGFELDIQTFGIGDRYDPTLLQEIDPEPTELRSPDDLAAAVTAAPTFAPRLISLELTLEADGTDQGVIATGASAALRVEGTDYELPLASIENIEALLGASNRINTLARFDLDGDDSTAEIELFASDVIGRADAAQTVTGLGGDDLLFGSDLADAVSGGAGDDVILGFDGADTLDGGAGADTVLAGAGDDLLRVTEAADTGQDLIDGGQGRDVLQIDLGGNLSEELIPSLDLRNIEAIDIDNNAANVLEITLADVVDLSSTGDSELEALLDQALPESAIIYGDQSDSLLLLGSGEGGFQKVSDTPIDDGKGNMLDIYSYVEGGNVLATLGVDTDIDVTGAIVTS